jgi:hypothetical protein
MSTATDMLAKYLAAEEAILEGKVVWFNEKRLFMEDLPEIIKGRREWEARVAAEASAASGVPAIGGRRFTVARFDE